MTFTATTVNATSGNKSVPRRERPISPNTMSANVTIVTDVRPEVLLVPNWAIRIDRATGKAYVNRLAGMTASEIEVRTGLRNESDSEVLSGVQEGDTLIVSGAAGLSTLISQATK